MFHPILNKLWKSAIYISIWLIIGFLYYKYLTENFDVSTSIIILETILNILILSLINIGIWYVLRFNKLENKTNLKIIFNHIVMSVVVTIIWIFVSWLIIFFITPNKSTYNNLFFSTLSTKAILGIVLYFFTIFFYYIVIYYQNNKENINRKNELSIMLQQQELNNLKAQINPHFLFNSLNSISYLIYSNPDDAHNSIVKLSEYFRYSLKIEKTITTIKEEIENINRYFDIEKIRFLEKMQINLDIDQECLNFQIPVMLLQPLAENAFKHGVYENSEKTEINISIKNNTDFYSIIFKNTFDVDSIPKKGTGTGLSNISKRLSLIYKRNDLMTVNKKNNIFEVKLLLPQNIEL
ncbi:MAG: histidine kinase [Bacteroidales bacterium]|nr:histidine kinase [Bacteroidales bacterium]